MTQKIESLLLLLLIFPVWWLIAGYYLSCSSKRLGIIVALIFVGGIAGFFIAFVCNGGAGGSSRLTDSAWRCLLPYLAIFNMALAFIIFSGRGRKES